MCEVTLIVPSRSKSRGEVSSPKIISPPEGEIRERGKFFPFVRGGLGGLAPACLSCASRNPGAIPPFLKGARGITFVIFSLSNSVPHLTEKRNVESEKPSLTV
jgi:hypothetical protein